MAEIGICRSIYFIKELEDVVGDLSEIAEVDGHPVATIGGVTISIPKELADKLHGLEGSRIGILRDDLGRFRLKGGRSRCSTKCPQYPS